MTRITIQGRCTMFADHTLRVLYYAILSLEVDLRISRRGFDN